MNSEGAFHLRLKVAEKECCESQRTFPLLLPPERRRLARCASSDDTLINALLRELRKLSSGFKAARVERRVVLFLSREVFPGTEINRILVPCRNYPALQRRLASEKVCGQGASTLAGGSVSHLKHFPHVLLECTTFIFPLCKQNRIEK